MHTAEKLGMAPNIPGSQAHLKSSWNLNADIIILG